MTLFPLSAEQFKTFLSVPLVKARAEFPYQYGDSEVEKEVSKQRAEKVLADAKCFSENAKQ